MPLPNSFAELCQEYLHELASVLTHEKAQHELALRPALADFLVKAQQYLRCQGKLLHEASEKTVGRPDFLFVEAKTQIPLGYIEAEGIETNLNRLTGHAKEQNERYRKNLDNFLLTNHCEFRLFVDGEVVAKARLPEPEELGFKLLSDKDASELAMLLERFFNADTNTLAPLKDPELLAKALARRAKQLRHQTIEAHNSGSKFLQGLHNAFKANLIAKLETEEFADLFAQTLAYGMFAARAAKQQDDGKPFDRRRAAELVPESNPFLRELFEVISGNKLDNALRWIADDIARLLDRTPIVSLRSKADNTGKEDVVIHFYETFLREYDPQLRELRGVYYTPQSVVSYIVRSLDKLLKSKFPDAKGQPRFPDGLANPTVKILDPATGTGTFLAEVIQHIYATFKDNNNLGAWTPDYIEETLVPRLFAFELLVAPYTIAHLKLNLLLRDTCAAYSKGRKRLNVYLTNTLEPPQTHPELPFAEFVSHENNYGAQIKAREDILVILGNPPYSGHSANASKDDKGNLSPIGKLLHGQPIIEADKGSGIKADSKKQPNYFLCDGKPLGERNPKWLNDDYVKFIRFAQWRIDRTGEGLVGFITNHGYLDNPTFRGMRQALMQSFDEIYVLDLHGNDRKKEIAPDGSRDENVFDIQQGVAILLAVKSKAQSTEKPACRVFHAELWGKRTVKGGKYRYLYDHDIESTKWKELAMTSPKYLYTHQPKKRFAEYQKHYDLRLMMPHNALGPNSHRDNFAVGMSKKEITARFSSFRSSISTEEAEQRFEIKGNRDWSLKKSLEQIKSLDNWSDYIVECLYRPFDFRYCYYHEIAFDYHRPCVNNHLLKGAIGLAATRQTREEFAVYASNKVFGQHKICAKYDGSYIFPLYLYDNPTDPKAKRPNLSDAFLDALAKRLRLPRVATAEPENLAIIEMLPPKGRAQSPDKPQDQGAVSYQGMPEGISPEDVFHYAYAMFHAPSYRERYADFLKIDFPRLPLTSSIQRFRSLAKLGEQLTALHLLDAKTAAVLTEAPKRHPFPESGNSEVEKTAWKTTIPQANTGRVFINATQYFDNVPESVWQHRIGGYQPAEKWLKDRKGRVLTHEDIAHYQKMLVAMAETQRLMPEINDVIGEWPMA